MFPNAVDQGTAEVAKRAFTKRFVEVLMIRTYYFFKKESLSLY